MEKNVLLVMEYDGKNFHGWQYQPELRTVQGEIERVLSILCKQEIKVDATGRTDAGVHALGQCATFSADFGIPVERIPRAANTLLCDRKYPFGAPCPDVKIISAVEVPEGFHARYSCKGKTYRYIISSAEPDVFRKDYCYFLKKNPDIERMRSAVQYIVGTHDFESFQAAGGNPRETTVRTVYDIKINKKGNGDVTVDVTGDGFLYNMVRIIVGTLVDVANGRIEPEDLESIIEKRDRRSAGHTAPASGLYLKEVYFDDHFKEGFIK